MKFYITDFFRNFLRIWSHILKKSVMENLIFVQCDIFFFFVDGRWQTKMMLIVRVCFLAGIIFGIITFVMITFKTRWKDELLLHAYIPETVAGVFFIIKLKLKVNIVWNWAHPPGKYMFKVNNRNTRTRCEICSKLTIRTSKRRQTSSWCLYY